ncbi:hypothetical protein ANN_16440 [Periplaneta americana]|uniref:Uncharacterized protein n=1 Tax=Periplaneta americana TaxID=6978 RepID=A0ABQ8SK44_PERAM|nr:hypothetical protein ANN_16440 [Periplaneta americana]
MAGLCEGGNEPPGSLKASQTHFDIGRHARIPTRNTILRWVASFRITGSINIKEEITWTKFYCTEIVRGYEAERMLRDMLLELNDSRERYGMKINEGLRAKGDQPTILYFSLLSLFSKLYIVDIDSCYIFAFIQCRPIKTPQGRTVMGTGSGYPEVPELPSAWVYSWATLPPGDINMEAWSSSTESYPAFARIELRENPGKNLNQVTCPDRDSNPGHLVSQPDALTVTPQVEDKEQKPLVTLFNNSLPFILADPASDSWDAFQIL